MANKSNKKELLIDIIRFVLLLVSVYLAYKYGFNKGFAAGYNYALSRMIVP